jgi:cation transport ATPase
VRAVAVLVVATPCPLILAVPVAIVAGISRAATRGVLVKGGGALEALGLVSTLVVDKTGTLTHGSAAVSEIRTVEGGDPDMLLRFAASVDQASQHAVAKALVATAIDRGLKLVPPEDVRETPGEGVEGRVGRHLVRVGGRSYVAAGLDTVGNPGAPSDVPAGTMTVAVAIDGAFAGVILMRDRLRGGVGDLFTRLRDAGIERIVLATGDRRDVADDVVSGIGVDEIAAELTPADKIALVKAEKAAGRVMMVGDGVNDAPALVEADLGVAMGAKGAAASAEAADVVLLRDSLDGLHDAVTIARRSRRIALESVGAGLGLSFLGMLAAAWGWLPPVQGALLQEAIDVAVILNALRALR